jgi:uncharacterized membrane protein
MLPFTEYTMRLMAKRRNSEKDFFSLEFNCSTQTNRIMKRDHRPKITIEPTQADRLLEGLAATGLLLLLLLPAAYYGDLPDSIPQHFNAAGEADRYGSKAGIWLLPAMGGLLYTLLTVLNRWPHIFNYPVTITPENADKQYRMATRLLRGLKTLIMFLFAGITWGIIRGAMSGNSSLGPAILVIVIGSVFGVLGWYMWAAFRNA